MVMYTVLLFLGLCVGYAAFSTGIDLSVSGNVKVTADECFSVTDNGDGTGTIDNYDTSCGNKVNIPQSINGLSITKIGDTYGDSSATKVFANKGIVKAILPKGLTYIGNYAFYGDKLKSIDIPDGVTYIGSHSFYNNDLTGELKLSSNIKFIGNVAFMLNHITKTDIPSSVTTLEGGAFTGNNFTLEDRFVYGRNSDGSINYSHLNSFAGYDASEVTIPETVTYLEPCVFFLVNVDSIDIPSRITHIYNFTFYGTNLSSVTFNEGLKYIGEHAFGNNNLKEISIPSSVNNIEKNSFEYNHNLTTIDVNRSKGALNNAPWGATNASINWSETN